jgi:hypothetical protein
MFGFAMRKIDFVKLILAKIYFWETKQAKINYTRPGSILDAP